MPSGADTRPRVLLAVIVYNGRAFVPRCIESAARSASASDAHVDVVVLDDCSPEPGWSEELEATCERLGVGYYRSPRNLGIPRNMNLGLRLALDDDYDYVIICNSDVVVPLGLADHMAAAAPAGGRVGSVTAWSNNVSIFSIPNDEPQEIDDDEVIDLVASSLAEEFGDEVYEIPTGVGFCMLMPTEVIREVGLLDPVFGRGYCEEVDWCRRAVSRGFNNVLAPATFVYHIGNATTREAGLLQAGATTVWGHEAIIDMRFPDYRDALARFDAANPTPLAVWRATQKILADAARRWGYTIEATWLRRRAATRKVQFSVAPGGASAQVVGRFAGFSVALPVGAGGVLQTVIDLVGAPPSEVTVFDRGAIADELVREAADRGVSVTAAPMYPERV